MKNYYEILEVNEHASLDTIKKVFKMQIKASHPDLYSGDEKEKMEKKVKELNEAYEVLSNEKKRAEYDNSLNLEKLEKDTEKELTLKNTIKNLEMELQKRNQIIEHFLGNINLDEYYIQNQDMGIRFKDNTKNESNYANLNSNNYSLGTNKETNITSSYTKTFLVTIIKIIVLIIAIFITLLFVSKMTNIDLINIIVNTFTK